MHRLKKRKFPILEYDPGVAVVEASRLIRPINVTDRCVFCFFPEVVRQTCRRMPVVFKTPGESGISFYYLYDHHGQKIMVSHALSGSPSAASKLEIAVALGCRKFIVCGGAGTLKRNLPVGRIIVPTSAIRGEGTSYAYLPPSREVYVASHVRAKICRMLRKKNIPFIQGKTWSTDAFFRTTPGKVRLRRSEGCVTVEMEAATFLAVAQFRKVELGYLLYAGDDASGATWDRRKWRERKGIRKRLFRLALDACLAL